MKCKQNYIKFTPSKCFEYSYPFDLVYVNFYLYLCALFYEFIINEGNHPRYTSHKHCDFTIVSRCYFAQ